MVDAKWDEIRRAFHGFDPDRVARMTPRAVDKLLPIGKRRGGGRS